MKKPTVDDYCWVFVFALIVISILFLFHLTSLINWAAQ